jgi:predicted dehydrogenase
MVNRREFLDVLAAGTAGLAIRSSARSYGQILGANSRLNFAVIGLNSRGYAHLSSLKANQQSACIAYVCDVDSKTLGKFAAATQREMGSAPATEKDFRKILELKDVDAISIASPDHWHTPMAIAGLRAGKHVYVEKPCSHNPAEGALLVEAQKKYGKLVQMGTQQRSSPHSIEIVGKIHGGLIGRAYYAVQLALVPHLRHRRSAQQWNPRSRCLPLGARRRLSAARYLNRRQISVQGRLAVL